MHFEIMVADGPALQRFYRDLFDWKIETDNEWQYGMVETSGEGGSNGGISGNPAGHGGGRVTVYALASNVNDALARPTSPVFSSK